MEFLLYLPLGPAGSRKPPRLSIILHFYRFCKYQIFVGTAGFSGPDCQKIAFLPYCVCRGDHWSPANLPQQRIFPGGLLTRQTGTGEQCSPLQEFFDSLTESTHLSILVAVLGLYLFVTYNLCFFFTAKSSSLHIAGCCQIILIHPQRQTYQT